MSQRDSGKKRIAHDAYQTPSWVTEALLPHIPRRVKTIWECAAGKGQMASVLKQSGRRVLSTDIKTGQNFLTTTIFDRYQIVDAIISNPPYSHAQEFIERALLTMKRRKGFVAMLLKVDFDSGKTRHHLFADHPAFSKKLVLTQRIRWIEGSTTGSPSENHAWYIWSWTHKWPPTIAYHFEEKD